jgi:hypothetical protein
MRAPRSQGGSSDKGASLMGAGPHFLVPGGPMLKVPIIRWPRTQFPQVGHRSKSTLWAPSGAARADILLVNGDPTTNIADTLSIQSVWRRGALLAAS